MSEKKKFYYFSRDSRISLAFTVFKRKTENNLKNLRIPEIRTFGVWSFWFWDLKLYFEQDFPSNSTKFNLNFIFIPIQLNKRPFNLY